MLSRRFLLGSAAAVLASPATADDSTPLRLAPNSPPRQLPVRLFGAQVQPLIENMIDDPRKVEALAPMHIAYTRFPGGSQANFYNWRTGHLEITANPNSSQYVKFWAKLAPTMAAARPGGLRFPEYLDFCRKIGAEPVLLPNMETSTLEDQVAWIRELSGKGIAPHHLEMGNEFWIAMAGDPDSMGRWPNSRRAQEVTFQYAQAFKPFLPADVKIAVQASPAPFDGNQGTSAFAQRLNRWNDGIKDEPWFDALTTHLYSDTVTPNLDAPAEVFNAVMARYDTGIDRVMLDMKQRFPDKEVWVTEWSPLSGNPFGPKKVTPAILMHALARGHFAFLRHPNVAMTHFHMLFFTQGNAATAFTADYLPLPHTQALSWFMQAANGGATYQGFGEAGAKRIAGGGPLSDSYSLLQAAKFDRTTGPTVIVQNAGAASCWLDASFFAAGRAPTSVEMMIMPNLSETQQSAAVVIAAPASPSLSLPAYSVTRMKWS